MPSSETIAIVQQTVPALKEHGETLTRHFYERMFRHNPEVRRFFNPAHQQSGTQQRALAGAICAYAEHIDNPGALADAVELIAQKHASLGIEPEHYPIVGEHLLASIREVLGEAATDEVINAWAEAYQELAQIFIDREERIYQQQEQAFGWRGFREFVVASRETNSDNIVSFYLRPADGGNLPRHVPGQYITVRVPTPDGGSTMRNYSLSGPPGRAYYRISVKREPPAGPEAPAGFVSNHLHDHVVAGDRIEVGPPCGEFTLTSAAASQRPLVLVSGGVGITPTLSMLHGALEEAASRPIVFVHGAINGDRHAFAEELRALEREYDNLTVHVRYSEPTSDDRAHGRHDSEGMIDSELLGQVVGDREADYYVCGPKPMLTQVVGALQQTGVPQERINFEFFGPKEELESASVA